MMHLPNYTLTAPIHQGTESVLYRGRRDSDGALVVVKLPRAVPPSARDLAQLRHEYRLLCDLDVPGVGRALELVTYEGSLGLVLADLPGQSLAQRLRAERLDLTSALQIAASVAGTLEALHRRGILHKDVNPSNLVVTPTGDVYLIDFGIATHLSQETQRALRPGSLEGTLAYLSPEQTGRMNRVVDPRTDLYSLGVTLYEMLAGAPPFTATDPMALIYSHIARTPPPLRERAPEVPPIVCDIVMKLLSKAAEDRYQTARGLEADLEECLRQWTERGTIAAFPLGQKDVSGELRIPQKLYGRTAELQKLLAAFDRARHGAAELLLVAGFSGIGKSALVHEIYKPIAAQGGYLIAGKFDQLHRSVPYAPLAAAFRDLLRQILTEPAQALQTWKERLSAALGAQGELIADLVPELELLLGPQPPVDALEGSEAQSRFALVFQSFLQVFCVPDHPLVLFLDDLQWADLASLWLLQQLLTAVDTGHLLVIGAYRDNEVDASHPLSLTLAELRKAAVAMDTIAVQPLAIEHATALIAETVGQQPEDVAPLAALVHQKTEGNPFFLIQLLRTLHRDGLLALDLASSEWRWDMTRLREVAVTSNVVELMVGRIQRLSAGTQAMLRLAACIGHSFDLHTLGTISERPLADAAAALWPALAEGFLVPLDAEYRFLHPSEHPGRAPLVGDFPVHYRFLHDRVQQAAYSLIEDDQRQAVHLAIGRLLWKRAGESALGEQLFDIAEHMNRGAARLTDPAERLALARLDLAAGQKAKAATAHEAATGYFAAGLALLPEARWVEHYALTFTLSREQAECEQLAGRHERAHALLDALLAEELPRLDRIEVQSLRINQLIIQARYPDAVRAVRDSLALLDIGLPEEETQLEPAIADEMAKLDAHLSARRFQDLIDLPELVDPERRAFAQLFSCAQTATLFFDARIAHLLTVMFVNMSLEHGVCALSSYGFGCLGQALCTYFGRYAEGYECGKLAVSLAERFKVPFFEGIVCICLGATTATYRKHLRESITYLERGYRTCLASSNFMYLSYATFALGMHRLGAGDDLSALRQDIARHVALAQRLRNPLCAAFVEVTRQVVGNLRGQTHGRLTLSSDTFDEEAFLRAAEQRGVGMAVGWYYVQKAALAFLYEDFAAAGSFAAQARQRRMYMPGIYCSLEILLWSCLPLFALYPAASAAEQAAFDEEIACHRAQIADLSDSCPETYAHWLLLLDAERARVEGRAQAIRLYEQAITAAHAQGFVQLEALGSELCARFYLGFGDTAAAQVHLTRAADAYGRWGATAKVAQLEEKYPMLLRVAESVVDITHTTASRSLSGAVLDAAAVLAAAQTIAGEIVLPKLVDRLLRIVLTHAGAQKGTLLLHRDDTLQLEATMTAEPERVEVGLALPAERATDLSQTLLNYVARTREPVVLADALADPRFAADPAIVAHKPRSLLCMPLLHQGRLTGLLYLEHRAAPDVFDPGRVALLGLLSAQTAIALENALLLASVEAATLQVRRANEQLEQDVARRTEELSHANAELARTNQQLSVELGERARAEKERAQLQAQVIAVQQERMAEMATPLIPITDDIVVMPLIGTLDSERANQMLEVALAGTQRQRARVVILDITGIKHADTHVADMLLRTAQALRLLGAEAVLSGMRPEIAKAFIALGVELGAVTTQGTLQSAIAHALRRTAAPRHRSALR